MTEADVVAKLQDEQWKHCRQSAEQFEVAAERAFWPAYWKVSLLKMLGLA